MQSKHQQSVTGILTSLGFDTVYLFSNSCGSWNGAMLVTSWALFVGSVVGVQSIWCAELFHTPLFRRQQQLVQKGGVLELA